MIVESYEDVIVLSGALHHNNWDTIRTAIALMLKRHPSGVVLDCSGLTEANADGAQTFHDALAYVKTHEEARIVLAAVPPAIRAVLAETPEVRSQLPIVETVEEARRSLDALASFEGDKKKSRLDKKEYQVRVLCVLQGCESDMDVLVMTRELVNNISAKVDILLPVIVPRDLPLTAPMADYEEKAAKSAERASDTLADCRTPYAIRMERARDLATLLSEESEAINASYTVLAVPEEGLEEGKRARIMNSVLCKVRGPVLFVRGHAVCLE